MPSFLTPTAITLEIRNAHGVVAVELAEVTTTTVSVVATEAHPLGFLDDLFRSLPARFRPDSAPNSAPDDASAAAADNRGELARVEFDGEHAVLVVDTDPVSTGWKTGCEVRITAPLGSGVRVAAKSADVTVTGLTGPVDIRTASGDVTVDHVGAHGWLSSSSGDLVVERAASDLDARTASGDISVGSVAGRAVLHGTSGNVEIHSAAGDVEARSVSGNVKVADAHAGQARLVAVSGDVQIGVHAGTAASLDLRTVSGKARSELEVLDELPAAASAALGIVVNTTSGDIRVHRAA